MNPLDYYYLVLKNHPSKPDQAMQVQRSHPKPCNTTGKGLKLLKTPKNSIKIDYRVKLKNLKK